MSVRRFCRAEVVEGTPDAPLYYLCDTTAERPSSGLVQGDLAFCKDTNKYYKAADATTWQEIGGAAGSVFWGDLGGTLADQTDLQTALDGKQPLDSDLTTIAGLTATTDNFMVAAASAWASRTPAQAKTSLALVKGDVGLGNVDNTSDASKPVSTATQTALDGKAAATHTHTLADITDEGALASKNTVATTDIDDDAVTNAKQAHMATKTYKGRTSAGTGDPEDVAVATLKTDLGLVKGDVGLGNVDNTSDASKPISTATQTALDAKQATLVSGTNIKTINGSTVLGSGDLTVSGSMPRGHLWGLTMSNAADAANDITIAAGEARSDDNTTDMVLTNPITKQLDAGWAVGTNAGGLNTGAEANSTWYEVHLIKRTDTGVVDVMFTTTANRATLPTNYTKKRRIGWIRNDAAGAILAFTQIDDHITLTTAINDLSTTSAASNQARTLTVPPSTIARFRAAALGNTAINAANAVVFREVVEADTAPTTTNGLNSIGAGDFAIIGAGHFELRVSASSTIEDYSITATGTMAYDISTFGWIDHRGKMSDT